MSEKSICIVAGGSGGHIMPGIAIAQSLASQGFSEEKILFITGKSQLDKNLTQALPYSVVPLRSGKLRRYWSLKNFIDPFWIMWAFFRSVWLLRCHRVGVVMSKGGFMSVPVGLAAWVWRIPLILHETDSFPSLSYRLLRRYAQGAYSAYPLKGAQQVGQPMRASIITPDKTTIEELLPELQKSAQKPLLLCVYGSQGSRILLDKVSEILPRIQEGYRVLVVTGGQDFLMPKDQEGISVQSSLDAKHYAAAISSADLIWSRAGGSIFEFAAYGKLMILSPLGSAADAHQERNARTLEQAGGCIVLSERATSEECMSLLKNLKEHHVAHAKMGERAKETLMTDPPAADTLAQHLLSYVS